MDTLKNYQLTKQESKKGFGIWLPLVLSLYISVTNLSDPLTALPFVAFCLGYALLCPLEESIGILLINMVYLGYSHVDLYPSVGISNYGFMNYCYIAVVIRGVLSAQILRGKLALNFAKIPVVLLIGYMAMQQRSASMQVAIYTVCMLVCVWQIINAAKSPAFLQRMGLQFTAAVLMVFVYYMLQYSVYPVGEDVGRFRGTRDANNFALWCNLCLVFVNGYAKDISRKCKIVINVALVIGVLITVSVSGVMTMCVIGLFFKPKFGGKFAPLAVGLLAALACVLLAIMVIPTKTFVDMGGIFERIATVTEDLKAGDYNSATTGRYDLWEYSMDEFNSWSEKKQLFGDVGAEERIRKELGNSSHNAYIDFLLNYGIVGIVLLVSNIVCRVVINLVRKEKVFLLLNLIIVVNAFFRTMSGVVFWLPLLV